MQAAWRRPHSALSLFIHPAQFPWLRRHPPAPFLARNPAAVARLADGGPRGACAARGSCVLSKASGRVGATPLPYLLPAPRQLFHSHNPFPTGWHPRSVPPSVSPGAAQPPALPGGAGEGRAAQAKLLSCCARSEVAAATAASRPLPGSAARNAHPPVTTATCPRPCGPSRDSAASPPRTRQEPRFPAESGWGRAAGEPYLPAALRWGGEGPWDWGAPVAFGQRRFYTLQS
jgi:hypothetical protein